MPESLERNQSDSVKRNHFYHDHKRTTLFRQVEKEGTS